MDVFIQTLVFLVTISLSLGQEQEQNNSKTNDEIKGQWGPWTGWSLCHQTCGFGTQYRLRTCHSLNKQKTVCYGSTKQHKICNSQKCPRHHQDYRDSECSKHNHIYYGGKRYRWIPYINDQSPCELSCKSLGYGYYARFNTTVEDGVTCNDDNTAACFSGKCLESGCDDVLGSGNKNDICGVCGGSGDSCRNITVIFTRTRLAYRRYNLVATLPAGATSINITEIGRSKNHLALSTEKGYFLNGNLRLQGEGSVEGAGTIFQYKRGRRRGCIGECLSAPGPLNTSVKLELIYFGRNPGVKYTYALSNSIAVPNHIQDETTTSAQQQQHAQRSHKANTHTANTDTESQPLSNRYLQDGHPDPNRIIRRNKNSKHNEHFKQNHLHYLRRTNSNTQRNKNSLKQVINKTDYTKNPAKRIVNKTEKVQYRHYYHTNELDGIGDVPIKGKANNIQSSYKLNDRASSNYARNTRYPSSSSSSSKISDNNIPLPLNLEDKTRRGQSVNKLTRIDTSIIANNVHSKAYDNGRRLSTQEATYSWRISGFSACSQSCGGGLQKTRIVCMKSDSQVEVIEENCDARARPDPTIVVCNNQPCKPDWKLNPWSDCSVTCGRGLKKRKVVCEQRISPTLTIPAAASSCLATRPQSYQYCKLNPCYTWNTTEWSKCSTVCGFGQRTRKITCVDSKGANVKDRLCTYDKPSHEEICDMGSCAEGWFHSKWTKECSAECGRGVYVRKVYCSASDGSPLHEQKCGGSQTKPRATKTCRAAAPCGGQWYAGPWTKCNSTCGSDAARNREVLCIKKHGKRVRGVTKHHNCDESKKPAETEACPSLPSCKPQWYMMAWSNCSKSCGTGVRTREVTCLDEDFKQNPDCDKDKKPSIRQSCNTHSCRQNFAEFSGSSRSGMTQILQQDGTIIDVPACEDKKNRKYCRAVSQARLCSYFKDQCCFSCTNTSKG